MEIIKAEVLTSVRADALKISSVAAEVDAIEVVDEESYQLVDTYLARVRLAKKKGEDRIDPIIKPIYAGLQSLYKLKTELLAPLLDAEASGKAKMKDFKLLEMRKAREDQERREAEQRRLEADARKKQEAEDNAKTEAMRKRLAAQREKLEEQAAAIQQTPAPPPVRAASSTTRTVKKLRIVNEDLFWACVARENVLRGYVTVDLVGLNKYAAGFDPAEYGLEQYDDVQIVGR